MPVTVLSVILLAISPAVLGAGNDSKCQHPAPVEAFEAAFFAAEAVSTGIRNVTLGGGEAAMLIYKEVRNVLKEHQQCNADKAAFTAAAPIASSDGLTLPVYFESVGYCIALSLYEFGLLDCSNAVQRALEYFEYVRSYTKGQDQDSLETYVHGCVYGCVDYFLSLGLKLEDFSDETTSLFSKAYKEIAPEDECKSDDSSSD